MVDILASYWIFLANIPPFDIASLSAASTDVDTSPTIWQYVFEILMFVLRCLLFLMALENYLIWKQLQRLARNTNTAKHHLVADVYQCITFRTQVYAWLTVIISLLPLWWWVELGLILGLLATCRRLHHQAMRVCDAVDLLPP